MSDPQSQPDPLPAMGAESLSVVAWEHVNKYTGETWGDLVRLSDAQQIIDRLTRERDAAFAMSRCECSADEACANLVGLQAKIAALKASRPDVEEVMALADAYAEAKFGAREQWEHVGKQRVAAARSALRAKLEGRT